MATRRIGGGRVDHGAQYFTARHPRFITLAEKWLETGVIREWFRHLPEDHNPMGYPRYCGIHGMSDLPKHLAKRLDVHCSERVAALRRNGSCWIAQTDAGRSFAGDILVVTAPLPQALDLLETSGEDVAGVDTAALRKIRYEKGLAVLAVMDGPSGLAGFGGCKIAQEPICWMADNQMKGVSPEVPTVTIHATAQFAEAHWDSEDAVRKPIMLEAAASYLQSRVVESVCHRWGFTLPLNPWKERLYCSNELRLVLAGDAFGGPRVEGAALSGLAAADHVLSR